MTPTDLLLWRRAHKTGQGELAKLLSVSRQTVSSWERGVHPIPDAMVTRILAINPAGASVVPVEQYVTRETAPLRPDLKLYGSFMTSNHGRNHHEAEEHPRRLLPHCFPAGDKIPLSILEHDIYKRALAALRAKRAARGPFPPGNPA